MRKTENCKLLFLVLATLGLLYLVGSSFGPIAFIVYTPETCTYNSSRPEWPDWNISETESCMVSDGVIELIGNLTIYGNLTFSNVTLIVNSTADGQRRIQVMPSGRFNITNSNITSNDTNYEYLFWVDAGSFFEMRESHLSECGYAGGVWSEGLIISTGSALLFNNTLTDNYYGAYLNYSIGSNITDNVITSNTYSLRLDAANSTVIKNNIINNTAEHSIILLNASNNNITGNSIDGGTLGINASAAQYNILRNNTITDTDLAVLLYSDSHYNRITDSVIANNFRGISVAGAIGNPISGNVIGNSIIANNTVYGIRLYASANSTINSNNISNSTQFGGIYINNATNITLSSNRISEVNYSGITTIGGVSSLYVMDSIINASYGDGIYLGSRSINCSIIRSNISVSVADNYIALRAESTNFTNITSNTLRAPYKPLKIDGHYWRILDNDASYGRIGMHIFVNNSTISGNRVYSNYGVGGIDVVGNNNTIDNNTVWNNSQYYGIAVDGQFNVISNNMIYNNTAGTGCAPCSYGLRIEGGNGTASGNTIYWNDGGIFVLPYTSGYLLMQNNISGNSFYGIYINNTTGNNITDNILALNGQNIYSPAVNNISQYVLLAGEATPAGSPFATSTVSVINEPELVRSMTGISRPVTTTAATVLNMTEIPDPAVLAPIPAGRTNLTSWEINASADMNFLCYNFSGTGFDSATAYRYEAGGWIELTDVIVNTTTTTICGNLTGTPYMIVGFTLAPTPAPAPAPLPPAPPIGRTIAAGETAHWVVDAAGVTGIAITAARNVSGVTVETRGLPAAPAETGPLPVLAYGYLEILAENITAADIEKVEINFSVDQDWIRANKINRTTIALWRFGLEWQKLPTDEVGEDAERIYFMATSPSLSYFAIGGERELPLVECPVCPEPGAWSACIERAQIRIAWYCGPETNWTCAPRTESRVCAPPEVPVLWPVIAAAAVAAAIAWYALLRLHVRPRRKKKAA